MWSSRRPTTSCPSRRHCTHTHDWELHVLLAGIAHNTRHTIESFMSFSQALHTTHDWEPHVLLAGIAHIHTYTHTHTHTHSYKHIYIYIIYILWVREHFIYIYINKNFISVNSSLNWWVYGGYVFYAWVVGWSFDIKI